MTKLPIDVIPNTNPPKFRWRQAVSTPSGKVWQDFEGVLPPSCEQVVVKLIELCKQLDRDCERLNEELRVALTPTVGISTAKPQQAASAQSQPAIKRK